MVLYRLQERKAKLNNNPIGVFDSGIGGLTVVKGILKHLPEENIIYLGDTARVPYGTRSKEVIKKFALELTNFLLKRNVKFLVVACNTISSNCFEEIKKISTVPVLGVIEVTVQKAVQITKTNVIGVIGTQATTSSKVYEKIIKKLNPKIKVITQACPLFVPLAEEGLVDDEFTKLIAEKYLRKFRRSKMDVLILGCTHYPVLKKVILKVVGKSVYLIDSAQQVSIKLKELLEMNNLKGNKKTKDEYIVTDAPDRVYNVAKGFLGQALDGKLQKINL